MFVPPSITRALNSQTTDPYLMSVQAPFVAADPASNYFPDWNNPNGKEVVDMSTLTGTTLVICVGGQSNTTNVTPALYVPTNRLNVINFNICDGGFYRAKSGGAIDPLLGCSGDVDYGLPNKWPNGNWPGILADSLVTAGICNNVVVVPFGVGGSYIHNWESGGSSAPRIPVMYNRLTKAGLTPSCILWGQGESDRGTTSQAAYTTSLTSFIGVLRTYWSSSVPIFIAQESYIAGSGDTNITNAQASVVNHGTGIWAGPNLDTLTGANRQSDNTHWSTTGASNCAAAWKTAIHLYGAPF